ncbi:hypothetical protein PSH58_09465 [Pseudomonas hefeiensis]|uniref:Transposase n=1 Tax=Pseudomonas hefeiensis TaxID=2738125 RepID=A0ABY9GIY7_9PSED|nr:MULTISPECIES: hypothetical protein [unclassified Pseudomonas]WLH15593.1 hypothetical protein PSH57_09460 [Pseudomonas sp. FP205]WLH98634.1 hypothetical protein PSH58_09465 [Pseudomonas sp. FP53]WLI42895.1 hypothetical protein PSH74_09450 [Pseudomonas sp. FP821]
MEIRRKALSGKAFKVVGEKLTLLTLFPWVNMKMPNKPRAGHLLKLYSELRNPQALIHSHALSSTVRQSVRLWVVLGLERQALQRAHEHAVWCLERILEESEWCESATGLAAQKGSYLRGRPSDSSQTLFYMACIFTNRAKRASNILTRL